VKILVTGGAGFTLLLYKTFNESWVETTTCLFDAQLSWRSM
jgi:hypothetical protein